MIRLALSIQQRNRQQQQEDAQRQFLQHVAKTLPGKGQPVTFSYADILMGKDHGMSEEAYRQSMVKDGLSETDAQMRAGVMFQERSRMMYAPEDMLAIQAHGQSLGLPHTAIGALTETVTGDAFVGTDDMRRSLLQEANQLSGWMRSNIHRSRTGDLDRSEAALNMDLSGGGQPAEPARLTTDYLKQQGLDLSQLGGDSAGARVFAGSSKAGQDMILNAMGAWGTPPGPGGEWSLEARNPGAQGSMYGEILDAIGGRLNQFETTKARGQATRHGLGMDLSGEDVDRAVDKGMGMDQPAAPAGQKPSSSEGASGAQQIQEAIEPRFKVKANDPVRSFLQQQQAQQERLFSPGRAAESDRLNAINRLLQYAGGR